MAKKHLVIGAAGFLGNNLFRVLLEQQCAVRGTVRNLDYEEPFEGLDCELDCELVSADLLDIDSLKAAMQDVDIVYNCAAVYKTWAKDPQKEIIEPNLTGTRNLLQACALAGVERLVYIGSGLALSKTPSPITEDADRNSTSGDPYAIAKYQSEQLARELSKKYDVDMVRILPSAMVGGHSYGHTPPAMQFYHSIMENKVPFDPCFYFNVVDVRDVVQAICVAAKIAAPDSRYILGPDRAVSTTEIYHLAHKLFPQVKVPPKRGKAFLLFVATLMEFASRFSGKKPLLQRSFVKHFADPDYCFDSSLAKRDLGFAPRESLVVIEEFLKSIA